MQWGWGVNSNLTTILRFWPSSLKYITFCNTSSEFGFLFFKTILKGTIFWEVNSILITILCLWPTSWKDMTFWLVASISACREDHFQNIICPKRTFRSDFVKLGSESLFFLAEKLSFVCLFIKLVRFWLTFLIVALCALCELRKMQSCTYNSRSIVFELWGFQFQYFSFDYFCRFAKMQLS